MLVWPLNKPMSPKVKASTGTTRIWTEKTVKFNSLYLDTLKKNYNTGINLADFLESPESARAAINGAVAGDTAGYITDLLPAGSVDDDTRFVMTNAVYLHAELSQPFEVSESAPDHFRQEKRCCR